MNRQTIRRIAANSIVGLTLLMAPVAALAQTAPVGTATSGGYCAGYTGSLNLDSGKTVSDVIRFGTCFLEKTVVPFLFAMAFLFFIYGVVDFIRTSASGGETEKKKEFMIWGIIALAVMTGVWGLVAILTNTFGVGNVIPQLPVNGQ